MARHERLKRAFDFLQAHAQSGESFEPSALAGAAGWSISTVQTYRVKRWRSFLAVDDSGWRVDASFSRWSFLDFLGETTSTPGRSEQPAQLRAFISAPQSTLWKALADSLARHDVEVVDVSQRLYSGASVQDTVVRSLRAAHIVVAVADEDGVNPNVAFELGAAIALGKKVLMIAPPSARLPADLHGMLCFRLPTIDEGVLDSLISTFLTGLDHERRPWATPKTTGEPLGRSARELVERLSDVRRIEGVAGGFASEALVASMFQSLDIQTMSESADKDRGIDFAVWVDELNPVFGNPILVEVKRHVRTPGQAKALAEQIAHYMGRVGATGALVLCVERGARVPDLVGVLGGQVLFVDLEELLWALEDASFGMAVRSLRNKAAHFGAL